MAESTLALKKADFQEKTAIFLGWGRGEDNGDTPWTDLQISQLKEFVDSAGRMVYWPALDGQSYDWSFMRPVVTLALAEDEATIAIPDDLSGVEGEITVASTEAQAWYPIPFVGVGHVYAKASRYPDQTGRPEVACQEPLKGTGINKGQRFQLRFFPTADADYTVQFQSYLLPDCLTDSNPFFYGGAAHAETFLEGCKAAAEASLDDTLGVHRALFKERLMASIAHDRRLKPQMFGYNGDRSDERRSRLRHGEEFVQTTWDGVAY